MGPRGMAFGVAPVVRVGERAAVNRRVRRIRLVRSSAEPPAMKQPVGALARRERDQRILKLFLPILATTLVEPVLALVDTGFIGRLGTRHLAGVGVSSLVLKFASTLCNFLYPVSQSLIASEKPNQQVDSALWTGIGASVILGTILGLLLFFSSPWLCSFMTGQASASSLPYAIEYLRWRSLALPASLLVVTISGVLRALEDSVTILKTSLFANILNGIMDYLAIFKFGFGVAGVAAATSISSVIQVVLMFAALRRKGYVKKPNLEVIRKMSGKWIMEYVYGSVLVFRTISFMMAFTAAGRVAAEMGTSSVAAFEVSKQVWTIQAMLFAAMNISSQSLVTILVGEKDMEEARNVADRCVQLVFYAGLALFAMNWFGATFMSSLFSKDPHVISLSNQLVRTSAVAQPFTGIGFVLEGVFFARKKFGFLSANTVFAGAAAVGCLAYLYFCTNAGISLVFVSINVLMLCRFLTCAVLYYWPKTNPLRDAEQPQT